MAIYGSKRCWSRGRAVGAKEELRQVYGVSESTESDGAANLIQKSRAINYALGELGRWCAYKETRTKEQLIVVQNVLFEDANRPNTLGIQKSSSSLSSRLESSVN
ncbi:hypothetical protein RHMOL_Rhmol10G0052200 [Rhododendron molle]|uniref:Uncharacterized protein n=1 Tax=Rhododendron molle TaxID=49168 RepID=A0ACC0LZ97_RHOML|nr:hypothetical protein RHMOL_Rhmol10G0052200 [Rhododendron molle]